MIGQTIWFHFAVPAHWQLQHDKFFVIQRFQPLKIQRSSQYCQAVLPLLEIFAKVYHVCCAVYHNAPTAGQTLDFITDP